MNKKITKIFFLYFSTLSLLGCVKGYDLSPQYNESKKILSLGTYQLNNISFHRIQSMNQNQMKRKIHLYKTENNVCRLSIDEAHVEGGGFLFDSYRVILDDYNDKCSMKKINNIYFMKCYNFIESQTEVNEGKEEKNSILANYDYFIANNKSNKSNLIFINISNEKCMKNIENHFYAKKESIDIQKYDYITKQWSSIE